MPLMTSRMARPVPRTRALRQDRLPAGSRVGLPLPLLQLPLSFRDDALTLGLFRQSLTAASRACRRKGLAQAVRRAEFQRHAQEIGRRGVGIGEGIAGHRDQRDIGCALVEDADRFEAAHVRHEDVDEHHVEFAEASSRMPAHHRRQW